MNAPTVVQPTTDAGAAASIAAACSASRSYDALGKMMTRSPCAGTRPPSAARTDSRPASAASWAVLCPWPPRDERRAVVGAEPSCPPDRRGRSVCSSRTSPLWTFGLDTRSTSAGRGEEMWLHGSTSERSCRTFDKTPQIKDDHRWPPSEFRSSQRPPTLSSSRSPRSSRDPARRLARRRSIAARSGTAAPAPSSVAIIYHDAEPDPGRPAGCHHEPACGASRRSDSS